MPNQGNNIVYKTGNLHYSKTGKGPCALLLFHGFGQTNSAFDLWTSALETEYTLYSFDLFFHGASHWTDEVLNKEDWKKFIALFLEKEDVSRFVVAGYSLGGKFALATVESFPEKTEKLFLLAPDGIKINFWYAFATRYSPMRSLFKSMIHHPGRFQDIVRILRTAGIVHKGVLRFAASQMDTVEKRERVYRAWVAFRFLKFDMPKIAAMINQYNIQVSFIVGRFDKLVPPDSIDPLLYRLQHQHVEIIEAGHNDVVRGAVGFLR